MPDRLPGQRPLQDDLPKHDRRSHRVHSPKDQEDRPITVRVPLNETARRLIAKYRDPDRESLFPFNTEQDYNRKIKEAFRRAGLDRMVTVLDQQTRQEIQRPLYETLPVIGPSTTT